MKITPALLRQHNACSEQVEEFSALYPHGTEPTVEAMFVCAAEGLDALWCLCLLPPEGPGSRRAFALWCAEQVSDLSADPRVAECLAVVRRRVENPDSVSDFELSEAARVAAARAARVAAAEAARAAAAWMAGWVEGVEGEAQIAMLATMLMEA